MGGSGANQRSYRSGRRRVRRNVSTRVQASSRGEAFAAAGTSISKTPVQRRKNAPRLLIPRRESSITRSLGRRGVGRAREPSARKVAKEWRKDQDRVGSLA